LPFGIQLFTDKPPFDKNITATFSSPLPFGIQLFTDGDGFVEFSRRNNLSPLPFGIQLFTDNNDMTTTMTMTTMVSIAFRHSALH